MKNDSVTLLNDEVDYLVGKLRENGQFKEDNSIEKENHDLVNVVGNIIEEVEVVQTKMINHLK